MASHHELANFLAEVERRAYKQALYAVHNEEQALDIVQDAMLKLSEKYAQRPLDELPPLFQRILQNTIRDYYRRQKIRNLWTQLLTPFRSNQDSSEDEADPLETIEVDYPALSGPQQRLERQQILVCIEKELSRLPLRQREAFLMRYWEEMSITETAQAMKCSEGSVKTHCSRACHTLAAALQRKGITL